jgi:hypothetical protein
MGNCMVMQKRPRHIAKRSDEGATTQFGRLTSAYSDDPIWDSGTGSAHTAPSRKRRTGSCPPSCWAKDMVDDGYDDDDDGGGGGGHGMAGCGLSELVATWHSPFNANNCPVHILSSPRLYSPFFHRFMTSDTHIHHSACSSRSQEAANSANTVIGKVSRNNVLTTLLRFLSQVNPPPPLLQPASLQLWYLLIRRSTCGTNQSNTKTSSWQVAGCTSSNEEEVESFVGRRE